MAFADLLDDEFTIWSKIVHALGRAIPVHLLTDTKSLFEIISKGTRTSEKRIILDIHAAREAYQTRKIPNISFVRSNEKITDVLTKSKIQKSLLRMLTTDEHEVIGELWILRK